MSEVLASLKKIGGNGEQYTEAVLWTNPSPTADFAAQTVTLSDSISNYKYIKISGKYYITSTDKLSAVMSVEDFRKCLIYTTSKGAPEFALCYNDSSSTPVASLRRISYVSDTQIAIDACRFAGSTSTSTNRTIPLEILGINELAHKTTIAMDLIGEVSLPANTATVTCTTTQNISDYKNLFITSAEYNGSALVTTSVATPPLQFVDTEYFASNSVTGYYAAGSTLTSYAITMQKLSDTSIQFTRPTASGTRQVYVYGIK